MAGEGLDRVKGWWVLAGLFPFGFGATGGFVYAAHRTGRRGWYVAAAVWALVTLAGYVVMLATEEDSALAGLGAGFFIIAWIGGLVHALAVRRTYVRMVREAAEDPARAGRDRLAQKERAMALVRTEPEVARELGVGRPDVPGAEHMGVVDVNHASAEALTQMSGVDADLAQRLIAAREDVQGFASAADAGVVLDLHPTTVERIARQAVFLPF